MGTRRPRPGWQVSLELWAPGPPRALERPGVCPSPGPSASAPVRRDPVTVAFPGVETLRGPGLGGGCRQPGSDSCNFALRSSFEWMVLPKLKYFACRL
ncbi:hypothetical protein R6Z07M_008548 [Ovis aries]